MPEERSAKKERVFMWIDGDFWEALHETINGFWCVSEAGEKCVLPAWKINQGKENFKVKWPAEKAKRESRKKVS